MAPGGANRPQETPGAYVRRVWRVCVRCPTGYPAIATVSAAGLADGSRVTMQRLRGSTWSTVATATLVGGRAEPTIGLPRGTHRYASPPSPAARRWSPRRCGASFAAATPGERA
jgi:hypothetical protein